MKIITIISFDRSTFRVALCSQEHRNQYRLRVAPRETA